ncbi:MAG TPA: sugar kinase [Candidatus Latescibacteria bacterium]|jgi:pantoate kinase|nr:sugar kinase [Gemmatimonadaceae bacterium]MDP6016832.1 sugar kinase [Candidatus Latescibacterota bacterium]HJP32247.1 sugar kinase [Candidatus Latescibacterota bacterium]
MTETARAFAPGNISGVFKVIPDDDPAKMHSLGLGFTVREGATVTLSLAHSPSVTFNGEAIEFPTVNNVLKGLAPEAVLSVRIETPLPLSSGFGLSGASSLAAAFAANDLLSLGHDRAALATAAHVAEVQNLTGLGDVCAQYHGGCLVKLVAGDPLAAEAMPVEVDVPIHYQYFSAIRTRDILSDPERRARINAAADAALEELGQMKRQSVLELGDPIRVSRRFAEDSGLLGHDGVRAAIDEVDGAGGVASMIMLGNAVFSTVPFTGSTATTLSARAVQVLP